MARILVDHSLGAAPVFRVVRTVSWGLRLAFLAVMLCACGDSSADSSPGVASGQPTPTGSTDPCRGGFATLVQWHDDGGVPQDVDGDGLYELGCDGDAATICIVDPLQSGDFWFGLAESGPGGWTGEDCWNGYGNYALCHPVAAVHVLYEVCTPGEVAPGQTTLLDASKRTDLTYYLEDSFGACFVSGADPAYYASLGCTQMR